jgi:hypothetical protein
MKVLLDECVDVDFRTHIPSHDVFTVSYMNWKGLRNGTLLAQAVAHGFNVLVTTDRSVPYQQHLAALPIAVVILHAASNDLDDLKPLVPALLATLNHVQPGTVSDVNPP